MGYAPALAVTPVTVRLRTSLGAGLQQFACVQPGTGVNTKEVTRTVLMGGDAPTALGGMRYQVSPTATVREAPNGRATTTAVGVVGSTHAICMPADMSRKSGRLKVVDGNVLDICGADGRSL